MKINNKIKRIVQAKTLSYEFVSDDSEIDNQLLGFLLEELEKEDMCRVLLHSSPESDLHNMIIGIKDNNCIYPHRHSKSESYHIIKGEVLLVYFNEDGTVERFTKLSNKDIVIARVEKEQFHGLIVLSKYAIYHETRIGPFNSKTDSVFLNSNQENKLDYINKLLEIYKEKK